MISLSDVLKARALNLEAERRREVVLPLRIVFPFQSHLRSLLFGSPKQIDKKEEPENAPAESAKDDSTAKS